MNYIIIGIVVILVIYVLITYNGIYKKIAIKAPNWYTTSDEFNTKVFETFMDTTMATVAESMTSSYSSSSGGGSSSGGSSSGGGSGGCG